ncbi:AAA family ATPase [Aquibium carbonis]|uniref:AAA family ATPase n=1 Tax=Aquibium carbonis TaxID=2495581 RepID=A0A429YTW2_9HYPH|nr:AAA family ATPase [Aquibium carbonis]RST84784.1 AAA family ATPase [Aquibium carbonis]
MRLQDSTDRGLRRRDQHGHPVCPPQRLRKAFATFRPDGTPVPAAGGWRPCLQSGRGMACRPRHPRRRNPARRGSPMSRKRMTPQVRAKVSKTVGRFLAYCSIMSACRHDRRLRRGTALALVLILPDGADSDDFKEAAQIALNRPGRSRWDLRDESERVVMASDLWGGEARKLKPLDNAILREDRLIILARTPGEVPAGVRAAVDDVIMLQRPTVRHVTAAARLCLGKRIEAASAEEVADMPLSLVASMLRRGRPISASLDAMRKAQAAAQVRKPPLLDLASLHGLGKAGAWGQELAIDLKDWREGRINWTDVDRGVLVSGPPGTGKTTFARALASTCDAHLVLGSLARWQSRGHLGDLLKAMRAAFAEAREKAPSILFIDEIDAVGDRDKFSGDSAHYCTEVVAGLLECIDGAERNDGVVIVGACNQPERIDAALLRPGRLDRHVRMPLPDEPARVGILRWHLGEILEGADLTEIAQRTAGWSGAGLEQLVRDARRKARRERRAMILEDLIAPLPALQTVPPALLRRAAIHEAGHAVVAVVLGHPLDHVELRVGPTASNASGFLSLGRVRYREPTFQERTVQDLLDQICVYLGGTAAEEVLLEGRSASAGGAAGSDLHHATLAALRIEASYGLGQGLAYLSPDQDEELLTSLQTSFVLRDRVEALLAQQMKRTIAMVERHRAPIADVAECLLGGGPLVANEIMTIMPVTPDPVHDALGVGPSNVQSHDAESGGLRYDGTRR